MHDEVSVAESASPRRSDDPDESRRYFRALVVEDDDAIVHLVRRVLERETFSVECVTSGSAAIELLKTVAYDLLIIDLVLPLVSGEEVMTFLEETQPHTLRRVIVMTASPRQLSCEFLQRICKILAKPFDIDELVLMARECIESCESCGPAAP
ncbi:MAG TPA: response regulator [Thermoanaerobaculia bacterium]|nr:response regulator [Thermoanaerobaculia bacterium]